MRRHISRTARELLEMRICIQGDTGSCQTDMRCKRECHVCSGSWRPRGDNQVAVVVVVSVVVDVVFVA